MANCSPKQNRLLVNSPAILGQRTLDRHAISCSTDWVRNVQFVSQLSLLLGENACVNQKYELAGHSIFILTN